VQFNAGVEDGVEDDVEDEFPRSVDDKLCESTGTSGIGSAQFWNSKSVTIETTAKVPLH
jgi:hypothetical protein